MMKRNTLIVIKIEKELNELSEQYDKVATEKK